MVLIFLESVIRIITLGLPQPVIRFCYNRSKNAFILLSSSRGEQGRFKKKSFSASIANAADFVDLCALYGYSAEEHIIQTGDGYLLGVHRLGWRKGEEGKRVNAGIGSVAKKVVYLHHGLMMNSEVWVCLTEEERCLPFALVEKGYDVWVGNNRGNKYSKKSTRFSPASNDFWDFSMDEFAFYDIPNSIDYILTTTYQTSLSYVGFSQGTAQAFATLSIHPGLNDKVDVFIALAPAMSPAGLTNSVVDSLVKASPEVLFLAFGRRSMLSSATMWQSILYPPIFVQFIDRSLKFLFNWSSLNISAHQKLAAYPHLFSYTSVKSVVHWFQIIRNKSFQMYDDDVQAPLSIGASDRYYKPAKFPTRNIKTPILLVYGGSDSLIDIKVMLKELPRHTISKEVAHFEHLDFLWAQEVETLVFPHVFAALEQYAGRDHHRNFSLSARRAIAPGADYSEDDLSSSITAGESSDVPAAANESRDINHVNLAHESSESTKDTSPLASSIISQTISLDGHADPFTPIVPKRSGLGKSLLGSNIKHKRSHSRSSNTSLDSIKRFGEAGISVGAGRPTLGGISPTSNLSSHDDERKSRHGKKD